LAHVLHRQRTKRKPCISLGSCQRDILECYIASGKFSAAIFEFDLLTRQNRLQAIGHIFGLKCQSTRRARHGQQTGGKGKSESGERNVHVSVSWTERNGRLQLGNSS